MQAEAGASIATRRKERIERLPPDIEAPAATIVAKENFDVVGSRRLHLDVDSISLAIGKCVYDLVEEEICEHLPVGPGIAVHRQIGLAFDVEVQILLV